MSSQKESPSNQFAQMSDKVFRPMLLILSAIIMYMLNNISGNISANSEKLSEMSAKLEYRRAWMESTDKRLDILERKAESFEAWTREKTLSRRR